MFSVIFEVHPKPEQWDGYLGNAKMLRPELEQVDGFVDNVRYKSLTRGGWILSLSGWRDEKSVVRWRTTHAITWSRRRADLTSCSTITSASARSRVTPRCPRDNRLKSTARRNRDWRRNDDHSDRCQMAKGFGRDVGRAEYLELSRTASPCCGIGELGCAR
jgi:heme-degrading monooxygenase HmoA